MQLEALCREAGESLSLPLTEDANGILRTDWEPLLHSLKDSSRSRTERAQDFHSTMAQVVHDQAIAMRSACGVDQVGLSGGVFQNRVLSEQVTARLEAAGFSVTLHEQLPCNDAGISLGQAAEWAALQESRKR